MSTPYVGEIRIFAGSFAPAGWAFCNGQLMPISENETLFNLIGTTFGGDGQETFALPDLQGRIPIHQGQGPGISQSYILGDKGGTEQVTLTVQQIPQHSHTPVCSDQAGNDGSPVNNYWAANATTSNLVYQSAAPDQNMNAQVIQAAGGSQPHDNMLPFLTISFIISLFGIFPSQT